MGHKTYGDDQEDGVDGMDEEYILQREIEAQEKKDEPQDLCHLY